MIDRMQIKAKVKDFMETDAGEVSYDDTLEDVIRVMLEKGRTGVVVKDGDIIMGVVSSGDVTRIIVRGKAPSEVRVRDFMTACSLVGENPCIQINEESLVLDALRLMFSGRVRRILVVNDEGEFTGIISFLDALKAWKQTVE